MAIRMVMVCASACCFAVAAQAQVPAMQATPSATPPAASASLEVPQTPPVLPDETKDLRAAPRLFLSHVNTARQACVDGDRSAAKAHMDAALGVLHILKTSGAGGRFSLSATPVALHRSQGSDAGGEAQKAYLQLNVQGDAAESGLHKAMEFAAKGKCPDAEETLASLVNSAVVEIPARQ